MYFMGIVMAHAVNVLPTFLLIISISCGACPGKLSIIFRRLKRNKTDILRVLHRLFSMFLGISRSTISILCRASQVKIVHKLWGV